MNPVVSFAIPLKVCTIDVDVKDTGDGYSVTLYGGTRPHIGSVALAVSHPSKADKARQSATVSIVQAPGHRDGLIAGPIAEGLARRTGKNVSVAVGVHIGDPESYNAPRCKVQEVVDSIHYIEDQIFQKIIGRSKQ